jgi:excinuclease ABC subunit C
LKVLKVTTVTESFDPKAFLDSVTTRCGVYQMYGGEGELLYVGKARNLRNRLSSYFRNSGLNAKTVALVMRIQDIQVTVTSTEADALLLENNLIKAHKPPFNILLKDDKSYPYIFLSSRDRFPRLSIHRGPKRAKGSYFGPYPSAGSVRQSLHFLQRTFKVRQCEDSYFRNRSRPCLQYQIDRCTAPCVGLVSEEEYAEQVDKTVMFLEGKSRELMGRLADSMERAAETLDYERAAELRDQLQHLQQVQNTQGIEGAQGDLDVVAVAMSGGSCCVQVLFVRDARVLGSKSYFPATRLEEAPEAVLEAFLPQFYLRGAQHIPGEVLLSHLPESADTLSEVFSDAATRRVRLRHRVRESRARWLQLALQTAESNLAAQLSGRQSVEDRLLSLSRELGLPTVPQRIECFDISHSSGEATVASCVVFDTAGAKKSDYRRFNIRDVAAGDDYAAMRQALARRFRRLQEEAAAMPDILLIDGGKGQVSQALSVLEELQVKTVEVVGVAKGTTRKAGFETLILGDSGEERQLAADHPALHLIQQIRDEAHRFAITGHRQQRAKQRKQSQLESIPGVGAKRRRELLRHFGSAAGVRNASVQELRKISGISANMAQTIYDHLHGVAD